MSLFGYKKIDIENEILVPFEEQLTRARKLVKEFLVEFSTRTGFNNDYHPDIPSKYKLPIFCKREIRSKFKELKSEYRNITWITHFGMDKQKNIFGFLLVDSTFATKKYIFGFDELLDYSSKEDISYETSGTVENPNNDNNVSSSRGTIESTSKRIFEKGTIVLELKNDEIPVFKFNITVEDDYDEIKAFIGVIKKSNKK